MASSVDITKSRVGINRLLKNKMAYYSFDKIIVYLPYLLNGYEKCGNKIRAKLRCFLKNIQMNYPARGKKCKHLDCVNFELYFLNMKMTDEEIMKPIYEIK